MPRIQQIDPAEAEGKAKELLDGVNAKLGMTPNLMRALANAPAALQGYLGFGQALAAGTFGPKIRESIALTVAGINGCDYCASAHSAIGTMAGLDADELARNLEGRSADPKVEAALAFASAIVEKQGWASDDDLAAVRAAGYGDGEITEITANVAYNIFTNYFNHVAETEIDFPVVATGHQAAA